jgi:hypothetical protein
MGTFKFKFIIATIFLCWLGTTQLNASIGHVSLLKGKAMLTRAQQSLTLNNGSVLEQNDLIATSENSHIQLVFDDNTVITLGSNSVLDIQEYLNDEKEPKAKFKFNQGTFKSITGHIGKQAPQNFMIETKTAAIGIRGTWIRGKIDPNGDWIWCLRGKIIVYPLRGGKSVEITEGHKTFVGLEENPIDPLPTGDQDFNDGGQEGDLGSRQGSDSQGDYHTWGYWEEKDFHTILQNTNATLDNEKKIYEETPSDPYATPTPASYIDSLVQSGNFDTIYVYSGTAAGSVMEPTSGTISASNNAVSISVQFASSSVWGSLDFKSTSGTIDYTGSGNLSINNGVLTANGFTGALAGQGANYAATGNIDGTFYGPGAEKVMGTFNTSEMAPYAKTSSGTFSALKQ